MTSKARAEKRRAEAASANGYIKVSNGVIFAAREPLQRLLTKSLPVRTSFALAKLANTLNGHLQTIETVRNRLIEQYGEPSERNPRAFQVTPDSAQYSGFLTEVNELFAVEVEVAAQKVTLPGNLDGLEIEAGVLLALLSFVDIEEAGTS